MTRWDVVFGPDHECRAEPHFCREWTGDNGCYGTNPEHGFTWEEARAEIAAHYQRLADHWKNAPEESA